MRSSGAQQRLLAGMQRVVRAHGNRVAVREPSGDLVTYEALASLVAGLRTALERSESRHGAPIGLLLERSASAYAAMWASVGLGRPYVPLNPAYPPSRLSEILDVFLLDLGKTRVGVANHVDQF